MEGICFIDFFSKFALVIIALANLFFAIKFFNIKTEKDDEEKTKDRKVSWLKTLILDHNLEHFYKFFDLLDEELIKLKQSDLSDQKKQDINDVIAQHFIYFRRKFIDIHLAVDDDLYHRFMKLSDDLQDHITVSIFDQGINLDKEQKFNEVIESKLMETKTNFLKTFFCFK